MNNLLRNVPFIDSPGLKDRIIQKSGAEHTAKEIAQQPGLWIKTYHLVLNEKLRILN